MAVSKHIKTKFNQCVRYQILKRYLAQFRVDTAENEPSKVEFLGILGFLGGPFRAGDGYP